ncbi:tRNA(5-methylaminomethyl-2-thiouridylate) methyltransferase [uncultured Mailhella sp.]|uniref:tRNA(5-methylaminomethyl-2-thiouridylate) methyltransferase n=1 Tax=uncultured Mailhella sp. TaxID=1981031 RepID=UPI00260BDEDE|nr:tRNA(5-methylaminomethyl-2-thiouridylate) methyltransferase [uncultured Mailhella sp.]
MKQYDGLALFSGGLDSILAARLLMEQSLRILCLHFFSPFFGHPQKLAHWSSIYGLDIEPVDVSEEYVDMLRNGPVYGFGSAMNPCVDCKILMMRRARQLLGEYGTRFLVSGEVLGQRPMSQRRDTLNIIRRDAGVKGLLLRPLCARLLDPTEAEESGLVDRSRLLAINGRGRKEQLALAGHFGISEIPTPGGGCLLTEKENTRQFWPVLRRLTRPCAADFRLAAVGRQFWHGDRWLSVGRSRFDNESYPPLLRPGDLLFKVAGFPGPLALGRGSRPWDAEAVQEAAALMASYSPKARQSGAEVSVRVTVDGETHCVSVLPRRETLFREPSWEEVSAELQILHKQSGRRAE